MSGAGGLSRVRGPLAQPRRTILPVWLELALSVLACSLALGAHVAVLLVWVAYVIGRQADFLYLLYRAEKPWLLLLLRRGLRVGVT